jgi:transposase InsO family protein
VGSPEGTGEKRGSTGVSRTAEEPGQTLNVDLCFVPASHLTDQKLPAVSGSSGRLVVERTVAETTERTWPGRIFDDPDVAYADAMRAFVAASAAPDGVARSAPCPEQTGAPDLREVRRALRQEEALLRTQRRQVRGQRTTADVAWRAGRAPRATAAAIPPALSPPGDPGALLLRSIPPTGVVPGSHLWALRHADLARRQSEDATWRQQRQSLRARLSALPLITAWIAILVITDNCTRRCLGLPLFLAGPKITAETVVAALRTLLPPELQFLISDRGVHFTAQVFAQLADEEHFVHVLIARHRPATNGIAERFVRTLKEWLADKTWASADDASALLACFLAQYNDRPHQGLALPGLSPNEFALRIGLF